MSEREAMIAGLVPAAGASRRMGRDKRRILYGERTVLEVTVAALVQGGAAPVVVVLDPDSPCHQLPGLAAASLLENPDPQRGMLSSIRVGLAALPPEVDAVAVLPGDHPFVPVIAVSRLLERYRERRPALLLPRYAGRRGHPLVLGRELFAEALACDDRVGLRELVHRHEEQIDLLDLELPGAEQDLDHPEDLVRLRPDRR